MFKVECPGCKASYNVDERRVPPSTGMKMRCPKCSTAFTVKRPDDTSDLPAVAQSDLPAVARGPAASPPRPPPPPAPPPRAPATSEADLPSVMKPPGPPGPPPRAPLSSGLDLPTVSRGPAKPPPPGPRASAISEFDLPSAAPLAAAPPAAQPAARQRRATVMGLGISGAPGAPLPPPPAPPLAAPIPAPPAPLGTPVGRDPFAEEELLPAVMPKGRPAPPPKTETPTVDLGRSAVSALVQRAAAEAELDDDPFSETSQLPARVGAGGSNRDLAPQDAPGSPPANGGIDELDLPSVAGDLPSVATGARARPAPAPAGFDLDSDLDSGLPAVRPQRPPPLAAPIAAPPAAKAAPARPAPPKPGAFGRGDRQITGGALFDDFDLRSAPSDLPAPRHGDLPAVAGFDLPSPRGAELPAVRGADLPALRGAGADLPSPRVGSSAGFGELDLPIVAAAALPSVSNAGLPAVSAAGLPAVSAAGLPPVSAAGLVSASNSGLPALHQEGEADPFDFSSAPLPPLQTDEADPFAAPLDFPPSPPPGAASPEAPFARRSTRAPAPAKGAAGLSRKSGGSMAFGEVNLGDDDAGGEAPMEASPRAAGPPSLNAPPMRKSNPPASPSGQAALGWGERDLSSGDDDMEFGAIPQEKGDRKEERTSGSIAARPSRGQTSTSVVAPLPTAPSAPASTSRPRMVQAEETAPAEPKPGQKLKVAAIVLLAVALGGGALSLTSYGPFGWWIGYDAYKAKEYDALLRTTSRAVRDLMGKDTATSAAEALRTAERALAQAPRARGVAAYGAFTGFLRELRFGHDAAVHAHATALLAGVPPEMPGGVFELARAARSATSDQLARSQAMIDAYLRHSPDDPDGLSLAGEIALLARDKDKAQAAYVKLVALEPTPRAHFGLARAAMLRGQTTEAQLSAQKVLEFEPNHAGAHLLLARLAWNSARDEAVTVEHTDKILKDPLVLASASPTELVDTHTLVGQVNLRKSRVSAAEASFNAALKIDAKSAGALTGLGEALYRAGRQAEALARFGSAVESDPEAVDAKVGVAKTKIALERLQEAKEMLKGLAKKLKDDGKPNFLVISWLGKAEEALGDKAAAEADYKESIKLAGVDNDVIDTYVWLAQLLVSQGRTAEAQTRLEEAKTKLPRSVALYKALGDIDFHAGRYAEADREFGMALQMDPQDISTRFKQGSVLRRLGNFDGAAAALDKVAAADKDYPGLSLERAVLFEAAGQSSKAVELYQAALDRAPDDPDLQLRVAAALLASGQTGQVPKAEELLRKVMAHRQNSAEANHFLGRAYLMKGTNLAEALRYLKRATELDPNRAEYWLYVGWAANEADNQPLAQSSLDRALELDHSLADAYWQRGVLRRRQRAVIDAEQDLQKALELRPSRYEAYATLAEVYEDQQKWPQALAAWQKAISADATHADWQYRLGKLMTQNGNRPGALEHLTAAVQLASQMQSPPAWLDMASLLLADAERGAGKRELALEHYQRFLSLAAIDSPYRADAERAVRGLGGTVSNQH